MDRFETPTGRQVELVAWAEAPGVRGLIEHRLDDGAYLSWIVRDDGAAMGHGAGTLDQVIADVANRVPAESWRTPRPDLFTVIAAAGGAVNLPLRFDEQTTHYLTAAGWTAQVVKLAPDAFVTRVWASAGACVELERCADAAGCTAAFSALTGVPAHAWKTMRPAEQLADPDVVRLRNLFAQFALTPGEQTELYMETQLVLLAQLAVKGDWSSVLEGAGMLSGQSYPRLRMGTMVRQQQGAGVASMPGFIYGMDGNLIVESLRDTCFAGAVLSPSKQLWYALRPRRDVFLRVLLLVEETAMLGEWESPRAQPRWSAMGRHATRLVWSDAERWYDSAVQGLADELCLLALAPEDVAPGSALFRGEIFPRLLGFFQRCLGVLIGDADGSLVFCPHAHLWSFPLSLVHFGGRDHFGFRGAVHSASLPMEIHALAPGSALPPACGTGKTYLWVDDVPELATAGALLASMLGPDRVNDPADAETVLILGHGFAARGERFQGPGRWSMQAMAKDGRHIRHQLVVLASCYGGAPIAGGALSDYEAADSWIGALGAHAVISSAWPIPIWLGALTCAYSWMAWRRGSSVDTVLFSWLQAVALRADDHWPRKHAPAGFSTERLQAVSEIAAGWREQRAQLGGAAGLAWTHLRLLRTWG